MTRGVQVEEKCGQALLPPKCKKFGGSLGVRNDEGKVARVTPDECATNSARRQEETTAVVGELATTHFADVHLFAARLERHQKVTFSIRSVVTGETRASLSSAQPPARARRLCSCFGCACTLEADLESKVGGLCWTWDNSPAVGNCK